MVEYLAVKHMALTSLTSLNSLTSPFAKVELNISISIKYLRFSLVVTKVSCKFAGKD